MSNQRHDVFLSHNSLDKEEVQTVADHLEKQGLQTWLDRDQLYAGNRLPLKINKAIFDSKSAAFFIGRHGLGRWQQEELNILEGQRIDEKLEIFPILLPGISEFPNKPELLGLKSRLWIPLITSNNTKALNNLTNGIRNYIHEKVKKELERLRKDKEHAEERLRQIVNEIEQLEGQLSLQTPERQKALDWLSDTKRSISSYGRRALKTNVHLEAAVKEKSRAHEQRFYTELENCMYLLIRAFRDSSYRPLDQMLIKLTLSDASHYGEVANFDVYEAAIDLIREGIPNKRLTEEVREDLNNYLRYLEERLRFLS